MVKLQEQKQIKFLCAHRQKEIDELSGKNIINTLFSKYDENITNIYPIELPYKIPLNLDFLNIRNKSLKKRSLQIKV